MEVYIYRGLSTVPSIDFNCLRTIAFIKLCKAPVKVNHAGNPFQSPNGTLPYMRTADGRKIAGYTQIARHLKEEGYCEHFNAKLTGLSDAYVTLLGNNLFAALQYYLWGDAQNVDSTRLLYAKRTPFPGGFWYPQAYIRSTDRLMQALENFALDDKLVDHDTDAMLLHARKCLNQFEEKCSGGAAPTVLSAPTELDATLFAYLAIVQNVLPHNNVLRTHLNECKRLGQFVQQFRRTFYGADDVDTLAAIAMADRAEEQRLGGTATTQDLDDERTSKWLPKVLAGVIAFGAMALFAYKQGIFQSENNVTYDADYSDADDDDDEHGDDD